MSDTEEAYLRHLLAWAVGWIEDLNGIPMQQVEEREGVPDASLWTSAHRAARWQGRHAPVCTDTRRFKDGFDK